jgi:cell division protein FtsW
MKSKAAFTPTSKADWPILLLVIIAITIGIIAVLDASIIEAFHQFSDKFHFARSQAVWALVGFIVLLIATHLPLRLVQTYSKHFFILATVFLVAVLIPGLGSKIQGARRWLNLGLFSFQPSELIKLAAIMYFPTWLTDASAKKLIPLTGFLILLLLLEPDLGTAIIIGAITYSLFSLINKSLLQSLGLALGAIIIGVALILTSPYRLARLKTFIDPTSDPLGTSYHIRQVLISLGSGGLFGTGFGRSRQKFQFLPEATTDSIFAVIAEETGFLGASFLILLFALFITRCLKITRQIQAPYPQLLALGVTSWIMTQIILNLSAMVSLIPLTGVPLPFISYGGSSLITIMAATGLLLNASRYRRMRQKSQTKRSR